MGSQGSVEGVGYKGYPLNIAALILAIRFNQG
jgi:hypothetical protein